MMNDFRLNDFKVGAMIDACVILKQGKYPALHELLTGRIGIG
jgi:hypothetical protein